MEIHKVITTIDTHTAGGPTRIIQSGIPPLPGRSAAEKMNYFREHFDGLRRLLINEPRGHKDMYAALVFEPADPRTDLGAFFMTASGYLPSCVHSSIGVVTAWLRTGCLVPTPAGREIVLETPAGIITLQPVYQASRLTSLRLQTRPAFVVSSRSVISVLDRTVQVGLVFSGVFFVLVEVQQLGLAISPACIPELVRLGKGILQAANRDFPVSHPENPQLRDFSLVMFYSEESHRQIKDMVINQVGSIDRSPCGAGAGALATYFFTGGKLGVDEPCTFESVIRTKFSAQVVRPSKVGVYEGGVPSIQGSATITGFHRFVLEEGDPLVEGFLIE